MRILALLLLFPPAALADSLLLKNASIVDPASQTVSPGSIVIRGDRIAEIAGTAPAGFKGKVVDLAGKFVVPGFTDMHTHSSWGNPGPTHVRDDFSTEETAKRMLYVGVTQFVDLFGKEEIVFGARDRQRKGKLPGADIFAAGPMLTSTRGHGTEFGIPTRVMDTPADARRVIGQLSAARHPDVIKIVYDHARRYGSIDKPTMEAACAAAHEAGIKTVIHIGTWQDAKEAVLAGCSAVTHLYDRAEIPDDLVALFRDKGVPEIPTMTYQGDLLNLYENPVLLESPLLAAVISPALFDSYKHLAEAYPFIAGILANQRAGRPLYQASLRKMAAAGVKLMTGTDAGDVGVFQGYSVHREMQILADSGSTAWQALAASTTLPNEFLGRPSGIRVGSLANLVALDASPIADIHNTERIALVVHHGKIVDRASLLASRHPTGQSRK